jgi:hypothetical protein
VQLKRTEVVYHGMASIIATLETNTCSGVFGQKVNDTTFTFITPVGTNNNDRRHENSSEIRPKHLRWIVLIREINYTHQANNKLIWGSDAGSQLVKNLCHFG